MPTTAYLLDQAKQGLLWYLRALFTAFCLFVPFLIYVLAPRVIPGIFMSMGWTLKKKTEGRRAHLIGLMDEENKKSTDKDFESKSSSSSGEWQKVHEADAGAFAGTDGADKTDKEFDGIVGFFHPFW